MPVASVSDRVGGGGELNDRCRGGCTCSRTLDERTMQLEGNVGLKIKKLKGGYWGGEWREKAGSRIGEGGGKGERGDG